MVDRERRDLTPPDEFLRDGTRKTLAMVPAAPFDDEWEAAEAVSLLELQL